MWLSGCLFINRVHINLTWRLSYGTIWYHGMSRRRPSSNRQLCNNAVTTIDHKEKSESLNNNNSSRECNLHIMRVQLLWLLNPHKLWVMFQEMVSYSWYTLGSYWEEATIKIAMRINIIFAIDFRGWFINQLATNYPRKLITTLQNV